MLAFVTPEHLDEVLAIAEKWEVRASVIGEVNSSGRLRILAAKDGAVEADIPAQSLSEDAPLYDRPMQEPDRAAQLAADPAELPAPDDCTTELLAMLYDPAWAFRQYDHQLFHNTVAGPGADAAVLRLAAPGVPSSGTRGMAVTTDGNHRWCAADPRQGVAMVVAEAALNLACVGAEPKAVVNCLNFGNPEHPDVMWQFSETIDGMSEACRALKTPVVGGNVSFYNESRGANIDPTPVIGMIGLIDTLDRRPPGAQLVDGARVVLVGPRSDVLTGSLWARARHDHGGGTLAPLDFDVHNALVAFVTAAVRDGLVAGAHDVAEGGLGLALAEMAIAGNCGAQVDGVDGHGELFSEAASRVLLVVEEEHLQEFEDRLEEADLEFAHLGRCSGDRLFIFGSNFQSLIDVPVEDLAHARSTALPTALAAGTAH
jgi:phosphoribosylformylglycinamidine synthase